MEYENPVSTKISNPTYFFAFTELLRTISEKKFPKEKKLRLKNFPLRLQLIVWKMENSCCDRWF